MRHVFDYNRSLQPGKKFNINIFYVNNICCIFIIITILENGSEYLLVKAIKGPTMQINKPPLKQAVLSIATKLNESLIGITNESSEVLDHFKMAFNYWELLTNKEPMCTGIIMKIIMFVFFHNNLY